MEELNLKPEDRTVVIPARDYSNKLKENADKNDACPVVAIELTDGRGDGYSGSLVTSIPSSLNVCSSFLLNIVVECAWAPFNKGNFTVIKKLINLVPWNIYFKCFYYILQEEIKKC